ncbi:MAG: quinolinate synthase NadA, partial [Gallionellaceae bacterium]|nr:quinolinate synthase NadA [Gallionellaceae bacterium]
CNFCPWMAMNSLFGLAEILETGKNEIHVDPEIGKRAKVSIERMLNFARQINLPAKGIGNA